MGNEHEIDERQDEREGDARGGKSVLTDDMCYSI